MAETLDVASMLPRKFEPKYNNRWVFALEGIDAYLIKTANRQVYLPHQSQLIISIHKDTLPEKQLLAIFPSLFMIQSHLPEPSK